MKGDDCYVCFLDAPEVNRIKIGCASDPVDRVAQVSLMCPVEVNLLGYIDGGFAKEAELHRMLADRRRRGEWFEGSPELRHEIALTVLMDAWNAADGKSRHEFLNRIDQPIMDRRFGGAAA